MSSKSCELAAVFSLLLIYLFITCSLPQLRIWVVLTLLGIGIAFGTMQRGQITMAKYIGGAKILAMA